MTHVAKDNRHRGSCNVEVKQKRYKAALSWDVYADIFIDASSGEEALSIAKALGRKHILPEDLNIELTEVYIVDDDM
jgi:hypothetical protein